MGVLLDGFPTWSQNADPDPSGFADPFAATDCGEECCSIVLFAQMHTYTTAGQVRRAMPGHEKQGETTADDIAHYLEEAGLFPMSLHRNSAQLKSFLKYSLDRDMPSIVLGNFISPTVLHWVVVIGYGDDHCLYIDPWYGRLDAKHWKDFLALAEGDVVLSRTRDQAR